jgi:hypothetical protein
LQYIALLWFPWNKTKVVGQLNDSINNSEEYVVHACFRWRLLSQPVVEFSSEGSRRQTSNRETFPFSNIKSHFAKDEKFYRKIKIPMLVWPWGSVIGSKWQTSRDSHKEIIQNPSSIE